MIGIESYKKNWLYSILFVCEHKSINIENRNLKFESFQEKKNQKARKPFYARNEFYKWMKTKQNPTKSWNKQPDDVDDGKKLN